MEAIPWTQVIIVVLVGHMWWTWRCCKKARQAYAAAEKLYKWVNAAHGPMICAVNKHPDCLGAGDDWPPEPVGTFPPPA